jgi:hypothetical protein
MITSSASSNTVAEAAITVETPSIIKHTKTILPNLRNLAAAIDCTEFFLLKLPEVNVRLIAIEYPKNEIATTIKTDAIIAVAAITVEPSSLASDKTTHNTAAEHTTTASIFATT